jgi:hypothetical protein
MPRLRVITESSINSCSIKFSPKSLAYLYMLCRSQFQSQDVRQFLWPPGPGPGSAQMEQRISWPEVAGRPQLSAEEVVVESSVSNVTYVQGAKFQLTAVAMSSGLESYPEGSLTLLRIVSYHAPRPSSSSNLRVGFPKSKVDNSYPLHRLWCKLEP